MKILLILLLIAGVIAFVAQWFRKTVTLTHVFLPTDRSYAFKRSKRIPSAHGFYAGLSLITDSQRVVPGRSYLKPGRHWFFYGVDVLRCSTGQYAVNFWGADWVEWKGAPSDGTPTGGPIDVVSKDGLAARVSLRASYRIRDEDSELLKIHTPGRFSERAIADILQSVRDVVAASDLIEFAYATRTDFLDEVREMIAAKLWSRGLELVDLWLGHIQLDVDYLQSMKDRARAVAFADAYMTLARARAGANMVLSPTLTPEILSLAQAEMFRSGWAYPGSSEGQVPPLHR